MLIRSTGKKQEAQRCQKGCCLYSIFFSETTRTIGTKLGRNVHLMVLKKAYILFVDRKYTKETSV